MAYGDFEDLPKRVAYVKLLSEKAYNIPKNLKYDGYQIRITSVVYTFFDKKIFGWWCYMCLIRNLFTREKSDFKSKISTN